MGTAYMCLQGGVSIFELLYHVVCIDILFVNPLIVQLGIPLPFDQVL